MLFQISVGPSYCILYNFYPRKGIKFVWYLDSRYDSQLRGYRIINRLSDNYDQSGIAFNNGEFEHYSDLDEENKATILKYVEYLKSKLDKRIEGPYKIVGVQGPPHR